MQRRELRRALVALGAVLADRDLDYHVVVAGGAALLLHEGLERATQDVDVVAVSSGGEALRPRHVLPTDLVRMSPTADEVRLAAGWVRGHYPDGPIRELETVLEFFERR